MARRKEDDGQGGCPVGLKEDRQSLRLVKAEKEAERSRAVRLGGVSLRVRPLPAAALSLPGPALDLLPPRPHAEPVLLAPLGFFCQ